MVRKAEVHDDKADIQGLNLQDCVYYVIKGPLEYYTGFRFSEPQEAQKNWLSMMTQVTMVVVVSKRPENCVHESVISRHEGACTSQQVQAPRFGFGRTGPNRLRVPKGSPGRSEKQWDAEALEKGDRNILGRVLD